MQYNIWLVLLLALHYNKYNINFTISKYILQLFTYVGAREVNVTSNMQRSFCAASQQLQRNSKLKNKESGKYFILDYKTGKHLTTCPVILILFNVPPVWQLLRNGKTGTERDNKRDQLREKNSWERTLEGLGLGLGLGFNTALSIPRSIHHGCRFLLKTSMFWGCCLWTSGRFR